MLSLVLQLPPMTSKGSAPSVASSSVTARSQSGISPTALTPTGNHLHFYFCSSVLLFFCSSCIPLHIILKNMWKRKLNLNNFQRFQMTSSFIGYNKNTEYFSFN